MRRSSYSGLPRPDAAIRPARFRNILTGVVFFTFSIGGVFKLLTLLFTLPPTPPSLPALLNHFNLPPGYINRLAYPTSFTRDVRPIPIHSHNDYWRTVPLYSALGVGAVSVEADVWEFSGELFVGHDPASLTRNRTFRNLYVDEIRRLLDEANSGEGVEVANPGEEGRKRKRALQDLYGKGAAPEGNNSQYQCIYDMDSSQTLHLYVDLKTPTTTTLPAVVSQLEPLRSPRNYLTHWNGTHLNRGCVTVHLTGATTLELMLDHPHPSGKMDYRDYFLDSPILDIASEKYNTTNTLLSTGKFSKAVGMVFFGSGGVTAGMKRKMKQQLEAAHEKGVGVRYWSTPSWPRGLRNEVWRTLVKAGVDLLNVDDLRAAAMMEW